MDELALPKEKVLNFIKEIEELSKKYQMKLLINDSDCFDCRSSLCVVPYNYEELWGTEIMVPYKKCLENYDAWNIGIEGELIEKNWEDQHLNNKEEK